MPSDDSLLCSVRGARPGIASKVIGAFPAAHAANCVDGVLASEDEGTQISGRHEIQNVAPPEGGRVLVRPALVSK